MGEVSSVERRTLGRRALLALLDGLDTAARAQPDPARRTALLRSGATLRAAAGPAAGHGVPEDVVAAVDGNGAGTAVFWTDEGGHAILLPLPFPEQSFHDGWETAPVRAAVTREYLLGAVLLRLEGFSVGMLQGDRLLDSRTGARWIHGRNRKGGQSQRRFERIRELHIQQLFDDTCQAAQNKLAPFAGQLDYVVLGGDRHNLQTFIKGCKLMQSLASRTLDHVLPIVEPKRATLERLPGILWQTPVLSWGALAGDSGGGSKLASGRET